MRKKVQVLPSSSTKVTIDKVTEYFTISNTIINSQGIELNKNFYAKKLPTRSSYRDKIVCCSVHGPHRYELHKGYFSAKIVICSII